MISQLQKRLDRYIKQSDKNDKEYQENKKPFEQYFKSRYDIDKKINAVFTLDAKRIQEQEFSDSQLDIWFDENEKPSEGGGIPSCKIH